MKCVGLYNTLRNRFAVLHVSQTKTWKMYKQMYIVVNIKSKIITIYPARKGVVVKGS